MSEAGPDRADQGAELLAVYDRALPQVYGYLRPRCDSRPVAEDLTAETFLAAVDAIRRKAVPDLTVAWLIGVARHKLVDHWRARAREERRLHLVEDTLRTLDEVDDPWDAQLDLHRARDVLGTLGAHHRAALTLRYLDELSVPEVAAALGRTVHAAEALLVRARSAFRRAYTETDTEPSDGRDDGDG